MAGSIRDYVVAQTSRNDILRWQKNLRVAAVGLNIHLSVLGPRDSLKRHDRLSNLLPAASEGSAGANYVMLVVVGNAIGWKIKNSAQQGKKREKCHFLTRPQLTHFKITLGGPQQKLS